MPGVFVGSTEIVDVGDIKIGGTDVQEIYVGATKIWPGGAPPFSPPDISGLQFWFDASDASTIVETLGVVEGWLDKSGNDEDLVQLTTSRQPTVSSAGGFDSISFDANDVLTNATAAFSISPFSMFAVVTPSPLSANTFLYAIEDSSGLAGFLRGANDLARCDALVSAGNDSELGINSTFVADTTVAVIFRHVDGGPSNGLTSLGATVTDATVGTLRTPTDTFHIGAQDGTGASGWSGHIHEIGAYNANISDADRTSLMDYLKAKWGIA